LDEAAGDAVEKSRRRIHERPGADRSEAALSVAYGAGLRVSEVVSLKLSDIDSERMMLRVEQGKGPSQPPNSHSV
jgi:integrase/recombinase XerD